MKKSPPILSKIGIGYNRQVGKKPSSRKRMSCSCPTGSFHLPSIRYRYDTIHAPMHSTSFPSIFLPITTSDTLINIILHTISSLNLELHGHAAAGNWRRRSPNSAVALRRRFRHRHPPVGGAGPLSRPRHPKIKKQPEPTHSMEIHAHEFNVEGITTSQGFDKGAGDLVK